ncbi:MAG: hypothetical protein OEV41_08315 [Gammaproteobacteria bacterium]|nr:hypothetical protein [Gammaproteobacteria bacterium]MDH5345263.1 hypothetical protein [Gammaproteobacteria bacterium]
MKRKNTPGLLLLAGLLAAGTAGAANDKAFDSNAVARQQAKAATEAAAREAAASVKDANRLDIDIQLVGPTSVKIAGKR